MTEQRKALTEAIKVFKKSITKAGIDNTSIGITLHGVDTDNFTELASFTVTDSRRYLVEDEPVYKHLELTLFSKTI